MRARIGWWTFRDFLRQELFTWRWVGKYVICACFMGMFGFQLSASQFSDLKGQIGSDYDRRLVRMETLLETYALTQSEFQKRLDTFMDASSAERKDLGLRMTKLEARSENNATLLWLVVTLLGGQFAAWIFSYVQNRLACRVDAKK